MARRLLSRDHVRGKLKHLKCVEIKEYETVTVWETASGIWFTVPHETPEKRTDEDMLQKILADVQTWNFYTGTKRPR
jgi:hypothetical protein